MQVTSAAFTAEETDSVRKIAHSLLVSWKKDTNLGNRTFTIGVSSIGGPDIIGLDTDGIGGPGIYRYTDESDYVKSLAWERFFNMPTGGLTSGMAEASLDNTSGRFTPRQMGGNSELFTAILPRRPLIINAGFEVNGADYAIPQFSGVLTKRPEVNLRQGEARLQASDYVRYFQNKFLDQSVMFTGQTTDSVLASLFNELGMATAQYELDAGINTIPFGVFDKGAKFSDVIHKLVEAENGNLYQDEEGVFRFENRLHSDVAPFNEIQKIIRTAEVIEAETPDDDHIINVVEIRAKVRNKQPEQTIFTLNTFDAIEISPNQTYELFVNFEDPVLEVRTPIANGNFSFYKANDAEDGSGSDVTANLTLDKINVFAQAAKITFINTSASTLYLTNVVITGRPAKVERDLYYRAQDNSSVTAYEEQTLNIDNDYIQDESWAASYAQLILNAYSEPDKIQRIRIRAIPSLQLGDLVSWQGMRWKIFHMRNVLNASEGFVQELSLVQTLSVVYFKVGISSIGGTDVIAP